MAGVATAATVLLSVISKLPDRGGDLTPWNHWKLPAFGGNEIAAGYQGPVLVTISYRVKPGEVVPFLNSIQTNARIRRRDGATWWNVFRDVEEPGVYVEALLVASWAEHVRQHDRLRIVRLKRTS